MIRRLRDLLVRIPKFGAFGRDPQKGYAGAGIGQDREPEAAGGPCEGECDAGERERPVELVLIFL